MVSEFNCLVAQSGGPTVAINSSLAGVIKAALESDKIGNIYGSINGIIGVLEERFINITESQKDHPDFIHLLKNTPAMYLGSCRYKLDNPKVNTGDYADIFRIFQKYNIKYFFYIGGNDSMDTVDKLSTYAEMMNHSTRIIGIPKTIDNDLDHIDHTPGYGSAAKYIASSVLEIAHDAYIYATSSVTIIEIMGRNAGWLTAASALARNGYSDAPHLIYLPEVPFSTSRFISDVKQGLSKHNNLVIAVSEGIKDDNGTYISAASEKKDQFGHVMLSGTGKYLETLIQNTIGCKVRSVELNVLQRCASHIASKTDLEEAFSLGEYGFNAALEGETAKMASLTRTSTNPYQVSYHMVSIHEVANQEKMIPLSWINDAGNDIKPELVEYITPLIQGEVNTIFENGLPVYLPVNHLTGK